jgi:hypothetical protein
MSDHRHLTKDQELARKAQQAFQEQERAQMAERGIAAEAQRRKDLADRTKRLRELRLARDAAEQESAKAKPAAHARRKRQPK